MGGWSVLIFDSFFDVLSVLVSEFCCSNVVVFFGVYVLCST